MKDWYRKLNIHTLSQANIRWSTWSLFVMAFIDASLLPLPISTTFLLLILIDSTHSAKYILFTTLGTLAGAIAGYFIGYCALLNALGESNSFLQFLFSHVPGFSQNAYDKLHFLYTKWGFWILFSASFTPIPYGLFSLSAGAFEINFIIFSLATIISQALKFLILAYAAIKIGPEIKMMFRFNLRPVLIIASICMVIAFLVTRII